MRVRRALAGTLGAFILSASVPAVHAGAGQPTPKSAPEVTRTVTLVTGDRITWHGDGHLTADARPGAQFVKQQVKGRHRVIPIDAMPMLNAGLLDPRLFDITLLLEMGLDRRDRLGLIVSAGSGVRAAGLDALGGGRNLTAVNGFAVQGAAQQLRRFWKDYASSARAGGKDKIWLDGVHKPTLDRSVPQIGAPTAWAAGFDGTGVKVAVLDTGIDATHPDLAGKVVAARNFAQEFEPALDLVGHGTHVASTIAGSGSASGGRFKGVAPGAELLDGKVCAVDGCNESWILDGMQWAIDAGADVVNLSLGSVDTPGTDPLEQAVNDLTARHGVLFVVSAGNDGDRNYSLGSPASADAALAVGAVTREGDNAEFSSRGPRPGDAALKPEITGPGVGIVAARSSTGDIGVPGQPYVALSGTSMAAPHVAGAAAILRQRHAGLTAAELKAMLVGGADPHPGTGPFAQGAGRVDLTRAIATPVFATPAVVSFGLQEFPHEDDPVLTRSVSYRNNGDADITLQLSISDSAGATFRLSADRVTVPAHGQASVDLIADTTTGAAVGPLGGHLVATSGDLRVVTPYGVDREGPSYTVTLDLIDRAGLPSEFHLTTAIDLSSGVPYRTSDAKLRVPQGNYLIYSELYRFNGDEFVDFTLLMPPVLALTGPRALTFDARTAKPASITLSDTEVEPVLQTIGGGTFLDNGGPLSVVAFGPRLENVFTGSVAAAGPPVRALHSLATAFYARPAGQWWSGPMYSMAWSQAGSLFDGFDKAVTPSDLVELRHSVAVNSSELGFVDAIPMLPGNAMGAIVLTRLPTTHTWYVSADVPWSFGYGDLALDPNGSPKAVSSFRLPTRSYAAGRVYDLALNRAVFGPTLPSVAMSTWMFRDGDTMRVRPSYGDGAGSEGETVYSSARIALYRDGELVADYDADLADFTVPSAPGRYRIEATIERAALTRLSTRIHTEWGFTSAHVNGVERLPVSAIGFQPALDERNRTRQAFTVVPIQVYRQDGSAAAPVKTLTVQMSDDDGATWRDVRVLNLLGKRFAIVDNPASGFVSLRASAEDRAGNTVRQTILRAYEIG